MVDTGFVAPQNIHRFIGKWMPIDAKMNMSIQMQKARLIDISSLDGGAAKGNTVHIERSSKRRLSGGGGLSRNRNGLLNFVKC